jgi:hypothetical protein
MSFLDTVLADTVGVGYRAFTGNVDPWTKANLVQSLDAGLVQGLGSGASPDSIAAQQSVASSTISDALMTSQGGADPSQSSGLRLPYLGVVGSADFLSKLNNLVTLAIVIAALAGGFYLFQAYGRTVHHTFRRQ